MKKILSMISQLHSCEKELKKCQLIETILNRFSQVHSVDVTTSKTFSKISFKTVYQVLSLTVVAG